MVRWLSGYETRLLLEVGLKTPISVGYKTTRRPGRVCLRRTPTALGSDVVCSTDWRRLTLTRRRISLLSSVRRRRCRGFPEGSPSRPPFLCSKADAQASDILWRKMGYVEREAAFADAGGRACRPYGNGEEGTRETSAPVLLFMDNAIIILM